MSTPNPQMGRVLVTIYEDILEFHLNAMIYFRQKRRFEAIAYFSATKLNQPRMEETLPCSVEKL